MLPLRSATGRIDVDETPLPDEPAADYVLRLARAKAMAGVAAQTSRNLPHWPILAADTTVTLDGHILGKPENREQGATMLRRYSGRAHTVLTAVAAAYQGNLQTALSESVVTFKPLSEAEIDAYLDSREAYAQGGRLWHPRPRRAVHPTPLGQLFRSHGAAPVRDLRIIEIRGL